MIRGAWRRQLGRLGAGPGRRRLAQVLSMAMAMALVRGVGLRPGARIRLCVGAGRQGYLEPWPGADLDRLQPGVEVGQLAVVVTLPPLAYLLRRRTGNGPALVRTGSSVIVLLALLWLIERAFDLSVMPRH